MMRRVVEFKLLIFQKDSGVVLRDRKRYCLIIVSDNVIHSNFVLSLGYTGVFFKVFKEKSV